MKKPRQNLTPEVRKTIRLLRLSMKVTPYRNGSASVEFGSAGFRVSIGIAPDGKIVSRCYG